MQRLFLICHLLLYSFLIVCSQEKETYDGDFFTFDYPSTFKSVTTNNSPTMVLKLASDSYYVSISIKEKNLDESLSIWDEKIVNLINKEYLGIGQLVSMTKEIIRIKEENCRCLKIMNNMPKPNQNAKDTIRLLTYLILHRGNLFALSFSSWGSYGKSSSTEYPEKIMKGLKIKGTVISKADIDKYMVDIIKKLNEQCPIQVDKCTTHSLILLSGSTIMIKSIVDDVCDKLVDYDVFKQKMCYNFSVLVDKSFVQYLDKHGYSVLYMIYNEHDILKKKVKITGRDILNYYQ